jgi:CheY-like chemotaxis protein
MRCIWYQLQHDGFTARSELVTSFNDSVAPVGRPNNHASGGVPGVWKSPLASASVKSNRTFTDTKIVSKQCSDTQMHPITMGFVTETFRVRPCEVGRSPLRLGGSMKTVLVLEDDPSNMQMLCALLWSSGYRVLEATTGKEALETANYQNGPIDLFISDVAVPVLSGTEVALELNKSHPVTPILFISGTPLYAWNPSDLHNFRQLPPDRVDFLEKPFGSSALLDKVGELFEGRAHHELTPTVMQDRTPSAVVVLAQESRAKSSSER